MSGNVEKIHCMFQIPNDHLHKIKLSKNLKELSENAFAHCGWLTEISIPDGVEKETFAGCTGLEYVILPASVKKMTKGVFKDCPPTLTLHAPAGSYTEKFAGKNGFSFQAV